MAQPTNTFSRYQAVGVREDLSDTISNISPVDTPFISNIGSGKATQTYTEWLTDNLATPDTNNAFIEGDDTTAQAVVPTTRLGNYTQISKKLVTVSGTLRATDLAGQKDALAYQMMKKSKELKRDIEAIATSSQLAVAGSDTVARKTAGFDTWLKSNTSNGAGGTNYTYTTTPTAARTAGTARAFTEALLKTVIALQWASGGSTKILMVNSSQKTAFSGFPGIAQSRHETGSGPTSIIGAADVYVSDFGDLTAVPNRFMPSDRAYLVDPAYAAIDWLRPYQSETLAKTGDADKRHLLGEWALEVKNEAAHAVIRDLI